MRPVDVVGARMNKTSIANYLWDLGGKIGRPCQYPFWWLEDTVYWIIDMFQLVLAVLLVPIKLLGLGASHVLFRAAWHLDKKRQLIETYKTLLIKQKQMEEHMGPPGTV